MQRPGDQLLAGPGLSGDEHGDARARQPPDGPEHLLHRGRRAEDLPSPRAACLAPGGGPLAPRGSPAHQLHRLVHVEGLREVLERPPLVGCDGAVEVRVRGHDDDRQVRETTADLPQQLEAVPVWHPDVRDHDVWQPFPQTLQDPAAAGERGDLHPRPLQRLLQHPADRAVVVDHPDRFPSLHSESSRGSRMVITVSPGRDVQWTRPPCCCTRDWAMESPRPVPPARPDTIG